MKKLLAHLFSRISRRERRALAIVAALVVAGNLLHAVAKSPGAPPMAAQLFDRAGDGDPLQHRDSIRRLARPLGASERIDVDHAAAVELTRLPGIGPALASRIVADRQSHGAFGGADALRRVHGIGSALLGRLLPHLSFGGIPADAGGTRLPDRIDLNLATTAQLVGLPGIGPTRARAIVAFREKNGPFRQLDDLRQLLGIPATVLRQLDGRLVIP